MKSVYRFFIGLLMVIIFPAASHAYVSVNGDVSGQSWTNSNTYYVESYIWIGSGSSLDIEEGTVVKFAPGTYLVVYGTLNAIGTTSDHIVFTSRDDNSVS